jgi:hypothetical protein
VVPDLSRRELETTRPDLVVAPLCGSPQQSNRLHSASRDQSDYNHNDDDYQNKVDQSSAHVERESKKPEY